MQITLINCKAKLEALGIHMGQVGAWDKLRDTLSTKVPILSAEYSHADQTIVIWVDDATVVPDMSDLGELVTDATG